MVEALRLGELEEVVSLVRGRSGKKGAAGLLFGRCYENAGLLLSCVMYCAVSLAIVFTNWTLFTKTLQYPVFVTWTQQVQGVIIYWCIYLADRRFRIFQKPIQITTSKTKLLPVLPTSATFVAMVVFANLCLKYTYVSTYMTARSLSILWNLLFSSIFLTQNNSRHIVAACSIQCFAFILGSLDPSTISPLGALFGCLSSLMQGFYNVHTKIALKHLNQDTLLLLYINLLFSSIALLPFILIFQEQHAFLTLTQPTLLLLYKLLISGVMATSLNFLTYHVINISTPLTFNILGITKSSLQCILGYYILSDPLTLRATLGIIFSSFGTLYYALRRMYESKAKVKSVV